MASHRIRISEDFSLWKYVALRGTGFPIEELSRLRSPGLVKQAGTLLMAQEELETMRLAACESLKGIIGPDSPRALKKLLGKLKKGRIPEEAIGDTGADQLLVSLQETKRRVDQLANDFDATFATSTESILASLREFADTELFREAVTWQNPDVVASALDKLTPHPNSQGTQKYHMVASYLTRYCAKNETIGFFGPTGWLTLDPGGEEYMRPGATLVDKRDVYFEYWCLDEVAQMASRLDATRPYVPVRQNPLVYLEGTTLTRSSGRQTTLPAPMAHLLRNCDGRLARDAVASFLAEHGEEEELEESDCFEILEQMEEAQLLFWRLPLAFHTDKPEEILAQMLDAIPGPEAAHISAGLAALVTCRDEVAKAAGDAKTLRAKQQALASTFESLTGLSSLRRAGQAYAGRSLCYEDTRRNIQVQLGKPFLDSIAPALDLVMLGARWYCERAASKFEPMLLTGFESLVADGETQIELAQLMGFITENVKADFFDEVVTELHDRWSDILGLNGAEENIHLSSETLRPRVEAAFRADRLGWPEACFHAPDLMIAANDFEELARGEGLAVLGEVHVGRNTILVPIHFWQSLHREELVNAYEEDLRVDLLDFVVPPDLAGRASNISPIEANYEVELGETPSRRRKDKRLHAASLVIECNEGQLQVVSRDGTLRYPALVLFQAYLRAGAVGLYSLVKKQPRTPRIQIDNLVVSRALWAFTPDELVFCTLSRGPELFLAARRWLKHVGLPERLFVKIPEETKPVYIDFASPISVEILARLVRKASRIVCSEMLPGPEQCWLEDSVGRRYTSELRMVAVDKHHWTPRPVPSS